jgi:hypothetical protein
LIALAEPVSIQTSDLQDDADLIPTGGGSFAVLLRKEFRIHAPGDYGIVRLTPGTALIRQTNVADLRTEVLQHLDGPVLGSELRLGVSLFLGREEVEVDFGPYAERVRAEINAWLGAQTTFVLWPGVLEMPGGPRGFFAGLVGSWVSLRTPRMALH